MIGHLEAIHDSDLGPDGRVMASSSFDKSSILWDVASGQKLHPPLSNGNARALVSAFSPPAPYWRPVAQMAKSTYGMSQPGSRSLLRR